MVAVAMGCFPRVARANGAAPEPARHLPPARIIDRMPGALMAGLGLRLAAG